ncbi:MAG: beta-glucosidase family protein [Promethearchaeota archaeon]
MAEKKAEEKRTIKYSKKQLKKLPFMDDSLSEDERVTDLLRRLTLKEKFSLLSGRRIWTTKPIKRLRIPVLGTTDGPNGVAFHSSFKRNTLFPTSICLAATWNRKLSELYGEAVGKETRAAGRHMILAPGINIDRTPLNGRTFEYLSEDPYLSSEMAIPFVKGVQSQRTSACVKHYVANNQETKRMSISAEIGKRALEEIYLKNFKNVVKYADPWCIMACYNKVNGTHGCEHKELLMDTLFNKWNFSGFVVSDWFATKNTTSTESCVKAGLSLEMPMAIKYKLKKLRNAYSLGKISDKDIDFLVERILRVMFRIGLFDPISKIPPVERNTPKHQEIARKIAEEGIVLLKNQDNFLPLDASKLNKVAIIGPNAKKRMGKPLYGGSSAVWPPYEITPYEGIKEKIKSFNNKIEIVSNPSGADVVFLILGLSHKLHQDSEGSDKNSLELPKKQIKLINKISALNENIVVILINGSPVSMEWIDKIPAVLEAWYGGMEGGRAIANVIFGDVNPSGKLPITFPKRLEDSPAHKSKETFPGIEGKVFYKEGIFVGYRHFDTNNIEPLFPFGFGLSYTNFEYSNLQIIDDALINDFNSILNKKEEDPILSLKVDIKNTGNIAGAEIVQLYIQDVESSIPRPLKELCGFEKVFLEPNETKSVIFKVRKEHLQFYDENKSEWIIEPGEFKLLVSASSRDIRLEYKFSI